MVHEKLTQPILFQDSSGGTTVEQNISSPAFAARTSVDTQQWAQPVTAGVYGVSSRKCQLEAVE